MTHGRDTVRSALRGALSAAVVLVASAALALDEKWVRLAKSHEGNDRIDAAFGLAKDGTDEALKLFLRLLDDDDVWVRDNAVVACENLKKPEQALRLVPRAASGSASARFHAAEALGRTGVAETLPTLRKLALSDRDGEVRRGALWALENFAQSPDAHAVAAEAAKDPDPSIRAVAVFAAGRIRAKDARAVVEPALADPDDRVRAVALYRLRWLDPVGIAGPLARMAADASPRVRSTCAEVAWGLQTPSCMDVLVALVADPDLRTAALAHRCLRHAAKKNLDRDPQVWKAWWEGAREKWVPKQNNDPAYFWDDRFATKAQVYGASLTAKRLAIVLDVSERMAEKRRGEDETRWDDVRKVVLEAVGNLADDVELNVILAGDEVRTAFKDPRALDASARQRVKTVLDDVRPKGASDFWGGVRTALDQPGVDTVLVVSWAKRDAGDLRHDDRVFEAIKRRAEATRAVIHTVWLTTDATKAADKTCGNLLWRISDDTLGRARMKSFL